MEFFEIYGDILQFIKDNPRKRLLSDLPMLLPGSITPESRLHRKSEVKYPLIFLHLDNKMKC